MKNLKEIIFERLHITKNSKITKECQFKSEVDRQYPNTYKGMNFVINSQDWPYGHFTFTMDYVKEVLETWDLNEDEREFVQNIYNEFKKLKKYGFQYCNYKTKTLLINGEAPEFHRAKFFYDMFNWVLNTKKLTIPRKQKIDKIMNNLVKDFKYYPFGGGTPIVQNIKGLSWPY